MHLLRRSLQDDYFLSFDKKRVGLEPVEVHMFHIMGAVQLKTFDTGHVLHCGVYNTGQGLDMATGVS